MVQIIREQSIEWPSTGGLHIEAPALSVDIGVLPEVARRRANGYLGNRVAMSMLAHNPRLVVADSPCWRFDIDLHLSGLGFVATLGTIDVDAVGGEVIPLIPTQITALRERADALIARFSPETAAAI